MEEIVLKHDISEETMVTGVIIYPIMEAILASMMEINPEAIGKDEVDNPEVPQQYMLSVLQIMTAYIPNIKDSISKSHPVGAIMPELNTLPETGIRICPASELKYYFEMVFNHLNNTNFHVPEGSVEEEHVKLFVDNFGMLRAALDTTISTRDTFLDQAETRFVQHILSIMEHSGMNIADLPDFRAYGDHKKTIAAIVDHAETDDIATYHPQLSQLSTAQWMRNIDINNVVRIKPSNLIHNITERNEKRELWQYTRYTETEGGWDAAFQAHCGTPDEVASDAEYEVDLDKVKPWLVEIGPHILGSKYWKMWYLLLCGYSDTIALKQAIAEGIDDE